jgi:hypothetical protein
VNDAELAVEYPHAIFQLGEEYKILRSGKNTWQIVCKKKWHRPGR